MTYGHPGRQARTLLEHLRLRAVRYSEDPGAVPSADLDGRPWEDYATALEASGAFDDLAAVLEAEHGQAFAVGFEDPEDGFYADFYVPVSVTSEDGSRYGVADAVSEAWAEWLLDQARTYNYSEGE